ncbi:MAG TPA: NADPH-dependent FMN reductase [Ktedonobacteraceae bacterium]|nr:NADPH-dependent FMN reductase [Ktedonobacteraceae bacterium]
MPTPQLQICLVGGSAEYPSRTLACLDLLAQHFHALGAGAQIWDLAHDPLPLLDPRYYLDPSVNASEVVRKFVYLADQADAFIWGSPVYHNSFSGVLKNALDSLSIQQFRHKPVALVSCGNNDRTGCQPCDHLRVVARGLHAIAIPTQLVALPEDFTRVQGRYFVTNEALKERAAHLAEELVAYACAMSSVHAHLAQPLLRV